jgi:tyrosyl-tRNA synthetase
MARSGSGWTDVQVNGHTVGFIVTPSNLGGKWHAYLDNIGSSGSRRVASESSREAAIRAVKKAAQRG